MKSARHRARHMATIFPPLAPVTRGGTPLPWVFPLPTSPSVFSIPFLFGSVSSILPSPGEALCRGSLVPPLSTSSLPPSSSFSLSACSSVSPGEPAQLPLSRHHAGPCLSSWRCPGILPTETFRVAAHRDLGRPQRVPSLAQVRPLSHQAGQDPSCLAWGFHSRPCPYRLGFTATF